MRRLDYGDYPKFEASFGGPGVAELAARGTLVYAATERGLEIWDLAESRAPRLLDTLFPQQVLVSVRLAGDLLYVLNRDGHLVIMDLASAPAAPTALCNYVVDTGNWSLMSFNDLVVEGSHAYAVSSYRGVYALDVANPRAPRRIARFHGGETSLGPATVEGNLLCLVTYGDVVVYDVSDAAHPVRIVHIPTEGWTGTVLLRNGILYMGDGARGLSIYEMRDAAHFGEYSRLECPRYAPGSMILDGDLLLSANYDGGLALVDVADPAAPRLVTVFGGGQALYNLTQVGSHVVAGTLHDMQVLDLANRESVRPAWTTPIHPDGFYMVSDGDQVFVSGYQYIDRLRLARSGPPVALESIYGQFRDFHELALAPGLLVATAAHAGLFVYVIDGTGPARLVGTWQQADRPLYGVSLSGTLAVVNCGGWLGFVDLTRPESPQLLAELPIGVSCFGLSLQGTSGYAAAGWDGLVGIDFSDPRQPRVVSRVVDDAEVVGVTWRGSRLLVGTDVGLRVYEAPRADSQVLRSEVALPAFVLRPVLDGDTVYLPTRNQGLQVVSLRDRDHPRLLGGSDPLTYFVSSVLADGHLLLAARDTLYELPKQVPGRRPPRPGDDGPELVRPDGPKDVAIAMKSVDGTKTGPVGVTAGALSLVASPNPVRYGATLALELTADGPVEITVYDVAGRCVRHLAAGASVAGRGAWNWDGRDDGARALPSGTYFVRAASGRGQVTTRVLLVR